MNISLIAAIGKNNELGINNKLLWNLPEDMKHFRNITRGHTVVMGRKTFESIGRPLPQRRNIILTRDTKYSHEGIEVIHTLEDLKNITTNTEEVFIIGGGELYTETIAQAQTLYITHVDTTCNADTFFPTIDTSWKRAKEETHTKDSTHDYNYTFVTYKKNTH